MDNACNTLKTITGRYVCIGNPCVTSPCLPGMAYAVLANAKSYYVTVNGRWFSENRSWAEYTPQPNDIVMISGYLHEQNDIFGKPFYTIEAVALKPAK